MYLLTEKPGFFFWLSPTGQVSSDTGEEIEASGGAGPRQLTKEALGAAQAKGFEGKSFHGDFVSGKDGGKGKCAGECELTSEHSEHDWDGESQDEPRGARGPGTDTRERGG